MGTTAEARAEAKEERIQALEADLAAVTARIDAINVQLNREVEVQHKLIRKLRRADEKRFSYRRLAAMAHMSFQNVPLVVKANGT